jgi:hypothetical protein
VRKGSVPIYKEIAAKDKSPVMREFTNFLRLWPAEFR